MGSIGTTLRPVAPPPAPALAEDDSHLLLDFSAARSAYAKYQRLNLRSSVPTPEEIQEIFLALPKILERAGELGRSSAIVGYSRTADIATRLSAEINRLAKDSRCIATVEHRDGWFIITVAWY